VTSTDPATTMDAVPLSTPSPLDRFMPHWDVRERFELDVVAPPDLVLRTATEFDMQSLPLVKAVFRLREVLMGAAPTSPRQPQGILAETRALGWGTLAEEPGRWIACGAHCQPWQADVRFMALAPEDFAAFTEPDQVKIAWTIEAHPLGPASSRLVQETRAVATDAPARARFCSYWRWARFGIVSIRLLLLPAVRRAAERQWRAALRSHGAS
jgi:hypothetical protein